MSTTSPLNRLRGLAASAMVGTDRSGAVTPEKLLAQAAALGAQARAGWRPRAVAGHVPPCPRDERAVASAAAMSTLLRLLGDPDAGLIEEWAELAVSQDRRVADATVPNVLDWWSRQPRKSESVFAALGKRGEWLAALNDAWRKPVAGAEIPPDADAKWQTGTTPERVALLTTIRRQDPARGLALVQSTWSTDGADERRRFLEVLHEQRSMADEPLLESALDDKSKVVRRQAAGVLSQLVGSRLRSRMNERARAMIAVESKRGILKRSVKLSLTPPKEHDKVWERDGIEEQAAGGVGKRAWLMTQILVAADLSVWTELSGLEPASVIAALEDDDYFKAAIDAIAQAAAAEKNAGWCEAIARALLAHDKAGLHSFVALAQGLPREHGERLLLELADHKRFSVAERWHLLTSDGESWSSRFSRDALALLKKHPPKKGNEAWMLHESVQAASRVASPSCAEEFAEVVAAMFTDDPTESFKKSIDRIRLRAEMHKEFAA